MRAARSTVFTTGLLRRNPFGYYLFWSFRAICNIQRDSIVGVYIHTLHINTSHT